MGCRKRTRCGERRTVRLVWPRTQAGRRLLDRLRWQKRLREALRALSAIKVGDPLRAEADQLRADIQRALIASAGPAQPPPTAVPPGHPQ